MRARDDPTSCGKSSGITTLWPTRAPCSSRGATIAVRRPAVATGRRRPCLEAAGMGSRAGHVADEGQDAIIDDVAMARTGGKRLEPPSVIGRRNCFGVVGPTRATRKSVQLSFDHERSGDTLGECPARKEGSTRSRAEGDDRIGAEQDSRQPLPSFGSPRTGRAPADRQSGPAVFA